MLYVVATPIGNLSDITLRAIDTLKSVDYILCEDTRRSNILLKHYEISKPLKSFHKFSERSKQDAVIDDLKNGKSIALISDAGTPGISDPGTALIQHCIAEEITVIAIPGPCAAIAALCSSGLDTTRFQFVGFLPKKEGELRKTLQDILLYSGTSVCYESPNRLTDLLNMLHHLDPERHLVVARELTKLHEECRRGTAHTLFTHFSSHPPKGEIVLLISGAPQPSSQEWEHLTPEEHVALIEKTYGISKQEAIVAAAKLRGVSKRDVYNIVHKKADSI